MVKIEINDDFFTEDERNKLEDLFNSHNNNEFNLALQGVILAALTEYKEMLLGRGLPTRANEIKQHRLLHLIKYYFKGALPTETKVSSMFQLTESESRALIRNVRTRFRYQLETEITATLQNAIGSAENNGDAYHVVIQSDNVLEELNRIVSTYGPRFDPINKVPGSARKYKISDDTYYLLLDRLNIRDQVDSTRNADE